MNRHEERKLRFQEGGKQSFHEWLVAAYPDHDDAEAHSIDYEANRVTEMMLGAYLAGRDSMNFQQ